MKFIRLFLSFLFIAVMMLNHEPSLKGQQSEDEIIEMRKKMVKKYPFPENSIELEKKFSFPSKKLEEKGTYLFGAFHISNDSSGNIYVSNSREHRILKFNSAGNLLAKIGREGGEDEKKSVYEGSDRLRPAASGERDPGGGRSSGNWGSRSRLFTAGRRTIWG